MNVSAATRPTNAAATSSMESMKRSIGLRCGDGSGSRAAAGSLRASPCVMGREAFAHQASVGGLVLDQTLLELLERGIGVDRGLAHIAGPGGLQRLGGLAPLGELPRRDRINLVTGFVADLVATRELEIGPRRRDLQRPFLAAMVVDHAFLGG